MAGQKGGRQGLEICLAFYDFDPDNIDGLDFLQCMITDGHSVVDHMQVVEYDGYEYIYVVIQFMFSCSLVRVKTEVDRGVTA